MAVFFAEHAGPAASTAVLATPGRRVRIRRLLISTGTSGAVRIKGNPGPSEQALLPPLFVRAGGPALDADFVREFPQTEPDQSLGYTSDIDGPHSIWLEYDLVA